MGTLWVDVEILFPLSSGHMQFEGHGDSAEQCIRDALSKASEHAARCGGFVTGHSFVAGIHNNRADWEKLLGPTRDEDVMADDHPSTGMTG